MKLTPQQQTDYAREIQAGFLQYDGTFAEWRKTLVGAYFHKYHGKGRTKVMAALKEACGHIPTWQDVTEDTMRDFAELLASTGVSQNTLTTYFRELKAVLNANRKKFDADMADISTILKAKGTPSQDIVLTPEEVEALYLYQPQNERERYVRKIMLLQCYSGCRHGDAKAVCEGNMVEIDGVRFLRYVSQKTKVDTLVPAHKNIWSLMTIHAAPIEHNTVFTRVLRAIGKRLSETTCPSLGEEVTLFRGGKSTTCKKYEALHSHAARKSFCTQLHAKGVDLVSIQLMAGHKNLDQTRRYIVGNSLHLDAKALSFFG